MARPFPLQTARDLAHRRLDDAADALRSHAQRLRESEEKSAELDRYRNEYQVQRMSQLAEGMDAGRLRAFDAFIVRLDEAIAAQRLDTERRRSIWESARQAWIAAHRRSEAMDALAERHVAAEALREGRAERKREDEFAGRAAAIKAGRS